MSMLVSAVRRETVAVRAVIWQLSGMLGLCVE